MAYGPMDFGPSDWVLVTGFNAIEVPIIMKPYYLL